MSSKVFPRGCWLSSKSSKIKITFLLSFKSCWDKWIPIELHSVWVTSSPRYTLLEVRRHKDSKMAFELGACCWDDPNICRVSMRMLRSSEPNFRRLSRAKERRTWEALLHSSKMLEDLSVWHALYNKSYLCINTVEVRKGNTNYLAQFIHIKWNYSDRPQNHVLTVGIYMTWLWAYDGNF